MKRFFYRMLLVACTSAAASIPVYASDAPMHTRFDIARYDVKGNALRPKERVASLLAPYTGTMRDFSDVQRALEALEGAYQADGYHVVRVVLPEQELNDGVIVLQVVESRIGRVNVEAGPFVDEGNVRRSLPGLREGQSPNLLAISKSLKLANENPAKNTTLQLRTGSQPDEVDAQVIVEASKPWRIGASLDNSGSELTGRPQLTVSYQHANIGNRDHVASLQYTTSVEHPNQVAVVGAGYHMPLYALGDSVDVYMSHSDVDAFTVLAGIVDLAISGKGTVVGARYNQNLKRRGDYESALVYGFDLKAYRNAMTLLGARMGQDVTVRPLSLSYVGSWKSKASTLNFGITGLRNLDGGSHGKAADFAAARAGAKPGYSALRLNASVANAWHGDWQSRIVFAAQRASDALVSGEQLGVGGAASVRGFAEREVTGDSGYAITAELYTPDLCRRFGMQAVQCRALAFYDEGGVKRNFFQPGDPYRKAGIASAGIGVRMNFKKNLALHVDVGHVLKSVAHGRDGEHRVHAKLAVSY